MTQVKFQCQNVLPVANEMQKYHAFISTLGMKLIAIYYARRMGSSFDFPEIQSLCTDNYRAFVGTVCEGWCHGGLMDLYCESFAWEDPLADIFGDEYDGLDMPTLADFSCAAFMTCGNDESTISQYSPKEDTEEEETEDPYFICDAFIEDGWNILYDRFCRKKPVSYPKDKLGEVVSDGMDGIADFINCASGSEDFRHRVAFGWLKLLNNIFCGEDDDDFYSVLNVSHPKGELIRKKCEQHKAEPFYKDAHQLIETCLSQIKSSTCQTGENPDWYEYDIVRDKEALSVSVVYKQGGFDITVISTAVYLLMWVIKTVEEKEKKERSV